MQEDLQASLRVRADILRSETAEHGSDPLDLADKHVEHKVVMAQRAVVETQVVWLYLCLRCLETPSQ